LALLIVLSTGMSVGDAYAAVNGYLNASSSIWTVLTPQPIVFKSEQTPRVYDPMSTLAFGYASCTGISILLIDALRFKLLFALFPCVP